MLIMAGLLLVSLLLLTDSFMVAEATNLLPKALEADRFPERRNEPYHSDVAFNHSDVAFSMEDGETLISSNGKFELGFFSPGSSKSRYIGIWFRSSAANVQTPIWVGNGDAPLERKGRLTLRKNGQLGVSDELGMITQITSYMPDISNATLSLLDNGNLVMRSNYGVSGDSLWQSFEHPTDTILPGMKFQTIISFPDNSFTSIVSDDEIVTYQSDSIYWSSGSWEGRSFRGIPEMGSSHPYYYVFEKYEFSLSVENSSLISRIVLNSTGKLQQWTWSEETLDWQMVWSHPNDNCHVPGYCGAQSICDNRRWPVCRCLRGHKPASKRAWSSGNFSAGCVRKSALQCSKRASADFLMMPNMRFKSTPLPVALNCTNRCELTCLSQCSCTAYYYDPMTYRCSLIIGDIFDLEQLSDEFTGGRQLHICLIRESTGKWKNFLWMIATTATVLVIFLCTFFLYRRSKRKQRTLKEMHEPDVETFGDNLFALTNRSKIVDEDDTALQFFNFDVVVAATDHFSEENKLGEGGFGTVHKGRLPGGREIAVKRLLDNSEQGLEVFKNEVILLANLQHINLMGALGYCIEEEEKILVSELMPNKSLDAILLDQTRRSSLDWGKRTCIIQGIAQGLIYLHNYARLKIIHRDIKASNILLDAEMIPKISDFGMARIFKHGAHHANTERIVGSRSYMSPEYAIWGHFSEKSDVFSFGVLLLEIVSGQLNSSFSHSDQVDLLRHAWQLWENGRGLELMDPSLGNSAPTDEVIRCIHAGLLCVQESIIDRPTMSHVASMLRQDSSHAFLPPKQPPTYFGK